MYDILNITIMGLFLPLFVTMTGQLLNNYSEDLRPPEYTLISTAFKLSSPLYNTQGIY